LWNNTKRITPVPDIPPWWSPDLEQQFISGVEAARPNEACALFYQTTPTSPVEAFFLAGKASPVSFQADEKEVIDFVYRVLGASGRVLGTGHSHPTGASEFSLADNLLAEWAAWHALAVYQAKTGWHVVWGMANSR
jgi:proteasome lid subunit RPN8/RPN11